MDIINTPEFRDFLVESKQYGYGSENAAISTTKAGGKVIEYLHEPFLYTDTYVGGNPYAGFESISVSDEGSFKPVWAMSYMETFIRPELDGKALFQILSKVLMEPDEQLPVRGPATWREDDVFYKFYKVDRSCTLARFDAEEYISVNGVKMYVARFIGGAVNIQ